MLYPLTFRPIFKERLWGGRTLETLYGKRLPASLPIGESWEISDREGDISVIENGPLAGRDLHWVLENHREALVGPARLVNSRFPLLIKILDARETLSLQVHPPASAAAQLKGEPKTEMWYLADAQPGAELFAGIKRGVTRQAFEEKLRTGAVAECFHRLKVRAGDAMFVPSGRVHAIGAGCTIFEVQQNSDTTYRVFDWNRLGPDGRGRELHVPQSLASIDFTDFEPSLVENRPQGGADWQVRPLVNDPLFAVESVRMASDAPRDLAPRGVCILGMLGGKLRIDSDGRGLELSAGQFCLLPASLPAVRITAAEPAEFLTIRPR